MRKGIRPWMAASAAWVVVAALSITNRAVQMRVAGHALPRARDLVFDHGQGLVFAVMTGPVFAASRRWPFSGPRAGRRAVLHLGLAAAVWAGIAFLYQGVLARWVHGWEQPELARDVLMWAANTFPIGLAVYVAGVGMEHAVRYFTTARERELEMARLSKQLSDARLSALEARVNPHFLFNTLNTIGVFVREGDRQGAARMVEHLSELLRRTLERHGSGEVRVEDELELARQYLAIEEARFSDRLRVSWEIDDGALGAAVPSFAVQHLVENAIRHGVARRPEAGQVTVSARRVGGTLEARVTDDGPGIAVEPPAGGGIENTRERLRSLYGEEASLTVVQGEGGGTVATLRIPYRELSDAES